MIAVKISEANQLVSFDANAFEKPGSKNMREERAANVIICMKSAFPDTPSLMNPINPRKDSANPKRQTLMTVNRASEDMGMYNEHQIIAPGSKVE